MRSAATLRLQYASHDPRSRGRLAVRDGDARREATVVQPREHWQHLVLPANAADQLTELGAEGWQLIGAGEADGQPVLYLKRRAPGFKERVTLEQRAAVFAAGGHPAQGTGPAPALPLLHPGLLHLLASTGHTDYFTICDRGFPVPIGPERIDLALVDGIPTVLDVLRAILPIWGIDRVVIAREMDEISPAFARELRSVLGEIPVEAVSHLDLKQLSTGGRATVRTGDVVPYANLLLVGG